METLTVRPTKRRTDDSKQEEQQTKTRRTVGGSVFPRDSLKKALTIAESIEANNAGKPYDRLDLAKSLNWSPNSSGFRSLITSSARYGATEGSYALEKIPLTPLGSSIVAPTSEEEKARALREALLGPDLFRRVLGYYDKKMFPREELFKNTLKKEFDVAPEDVDSCYEVLMANVSDYGILQEIRGNNFLQLDKLSAGQPTTAPLEIGMKTDTEVEVAQVAGPSTAALASEKTQPRVFISLSKNKKILDQVRQMLEFGGFEWEVAVERETTAIPIPEKVFGLMRKCNCAVINVSADEQEKHGNDGFGINQNVLIEIGAAFLQYDKRVILLVDKRLELPSNLQGLNALYYEGDELSWETGMRLQKALTGFRTNVLS